MSPTQQQLLDPFHHRKFNPEHVVVHERIHKSMAAVLALVAGHLPECREADAFAMQMQKAQMMASASISIHGLPLTRASTFARPYVTDAHLLVMRTQAARPLVDGVIAIMEQVVADIEELHHRNLLKNRDLWPACEDCMKAIRYLRNTLDNESNHHGLQRKSANVDEGGSDCGGSPVGSPV